MPSPRNDAWGTQMGGWSYIGSWSSPWLDVGGLRGFSFAISWQNVTVFWALERTNCSWPSSALIEDFTAAYRVLDPGFVDPVVGDPLSLHFVTIYNLGANYVRLRGTGIVYGGAPRSLQIWFYADDTRPS